MGEPLYGKRFPERSFVKCEVTPLLRRGIGGRVSLQGVKPMRGQRSDNGGNRPWRVSEVKSGPPFVAEEICRGGQ